VAVSVATSGANGSAGRIGGTGAVVGAAIDGSDAGCDVAGIAIGASDEKNTVGISGDAKG
jgi:hypothetical protein